MKKLSLVFISCLCLVVLFFAGCTYADNATLFSISDKYSNIVKNNEKIFDGQSFRPTYDSVSLNLIINSDNENFNILKTSTNRADYSANGAYGLLMSAINSTYLTNNALAILTNNEITEKQYKKAMYEGLESLQSDIKNLNNFKKSLESVFENDSRDATLVSGTDLTKYNLNKYIASLNLCLKDLLKFNKNYNLALKNNIVKPVALNDLLYGSNPNLVISADYNNQLINTLNITISNFILNYDIDILNNANDQELLEILIRLLNKQYVLNTADNSNSNVIVSYKLIRTLENSVLQNEEIFTNNLIGLNKNNITNKQNEGAVEFINNYKQSLVNYGNKLIKYLGNF